jgi:hypothetical protein
MELLIERFATKPPKKEYLRTELLKMLANCLFYNAEATIMLLEQKVTFLCVSMYVFVYACIYVCLLAKITIFLLEQKTRFICVYMCVCVYVWAPRSQNVLLLQK